MKAYDWAADPGALAPPVPLEAALLAVIDRWYIEAPLPSTDELARRLAVVVERIL